LNIVYTIYPYLTYLGKTLESWENLPLKFLDLDLKKWLYKIFSINTTHFFRIYGNAYWKYKRNKPDAHNARNYHCLYFLINNKDEIISQTLKASGNKLAYYIFLLRLHGIRIEIITKWCPSEYSSYILLRYTMASNMSCGIFLLK